MRPEQAKTSNWSEEKVILTVYNIAAIGTRRMQTDS
jgi:hypothetical protein